MPWTKINYPDSMKQLTVSVRAKAIEIANAILKENKKMKEGLIIATAIKNAKALALKSKEKSPAAKVAVKQQTKIPAGPVAKTVVKKQVKIPAKTVSKIVLKKQTKIPVKPVGKVVVKNQLQSPAKQVAKAVIKKQSKTPAKPVAKAVVKKQTKTPAKPLAKVVAKKLTQTPLWPEAKTAKKNTIAPGWLETFTADKSKTNKIEATKVSVPVTAGVIPELITHGEALHFIPVKSDMPPATKFEVHQAENIFHHREEVAMHQENQKVTAAMATRKNAKRIYRNNGQR